MTPLSQFSFTPQTSPLRTLLRPPSPSCRAPRESSFSLCSSLSKLQMCASGLASPWFSLSDLISSWDVQKTFQTLHLLLPTSSSLEPESHGIVVHCFCFHLSCYYIYRDLSFLEGLSTALFSPSICFPNAIDRISPWHRSDLIPWSSLKAFESSCSFKPPTTPSYTCMLSVCIGFVLAPNLHTLLPQSLCMGHILCLESSPHFPCIVNYSVSFQALLEGHSLQAPLLAAAIQKQLSVCIREAVTCHYCQQLTHMTWVVPHAECSGHTSITSLCVLRAQYSAWCIVGAQEGLEKLMRK